MKFCYDCANIIEGNVEKCPYCGGNLNDAEPKEVYHLRPGSTLKDGRYLLGRAIGYGGFGVTYAGFDLTLQRRVAIKEYFPFGYANRSVSESKLNVYTGDRMAQYSAGLSRFLLEARNTAKFSGEANIVSVLDFFEANNTAYIVMEFLDGTDLKRYLKQVGGVLPYEQAVEIIRPVCNALAKIHREGLVHRDISPDNIFITADNSIKLIDFGAARLALGDREETLSVILKPGFAPPEQYRSKSAQGPYTDIYALAATFYRMITGKMPPASVDRLIDDELLPPSAIVKGIPKNVDNAVMRAMALDSGARFASAMDFLKVLEGGSPEAVPVPVHSVSPDKSNKVRNIIIAAVSGVVACALLVTILFLSGALGGNSKSIVFVTPMPTETADHAAFITNVPITGDPVITHEPTAAPTPNPIAGIKGKIKVGIVDKPTGDWAYGFSDKAQTDADWSIINLTDSLCTVTIDRTGEYIVDESVVENYDRLEDARGNVTYTFTVNKDLHFNNGEPVKAENFLAWTLFENSSTGFEMKSVSKNYNYILGGKKYKLRQNNYLEGLRLIDEYTFSITRLAVGYDGTRMLPNYHELPQFTLRAVNLEYWFGEGWHVKDDGSGAFLANDNGKTFTAGDIRYAFERARSAVSNRVSAGAYSITFFNKSTGTVTLEANPYYQGNYEGEKPGIKIIELIKIDKKSKEKGIIKALKDEKIDMYSNFVMAAAINNVISDIDRGELADKSYCKYARSGFPCIVFSCDFGPTQYKEFRQAVAYLLDRETLGRSRCKNMCDIVNGPYTASFKMYKDSEAYFGSVLNSYEFDWRRAEALLKSAGFVYNADGTDYINGSGLVRYKRVSADEALHFEKFCTIVGGKYYMPARIEWANSGNPDAEAISAVLTALADSYVSNVPDVTNTPCATDIPDTTYEPGATDTPYTTYEPGVPNTPDAVSTPDNTERIVIKQVGMEFVSTKMSFYETFKYMQRENVGYFEPKYNMFNIASDWATTVYTENYNENISKNLFAPNINPTHLDDDNLGRYYDILQNIQPDDYESYLAAWREYIIRWNELLPMIPLYNNIYISVYPTTITNYRDNAFWDFSHAIIEAKWVGGGTA